MASTVRTVEVSVISTRVISMTEVFARSIKGFSMTRSLGEQEANRKRAAEIAAARKTLRSPVTTFAVFFMLLSIGLQIYVNF